MGARYTTIAASGFNATPPPDDGSQSASNLITWAGIKTKLADPLHTEIDDINTALVSAFDYSARQITTADTTIASDHMRLIEIAPTVSNTLTVALGDAATMTNIYRLFIKNSSAINQVIGRATGANTIDGAAANATILPGECIGYQTNGAASGYLSLKNKADPFVDSNPVVVGSADATKKIRFEVDGLTTATTRVITVGDKDFAIGKFPTRTVLTSGTAATYTTPTGATRINLRMVGGGGGGSGGGGNGGNGTASTWSGGSLSAGGGSAAAAAAGGAGGSSANGDINLTGASGNSTTSSVANAGGASGGNSVFGGAGISGTGNAGGAGAGGAGIANTGGGGGSGGAGGGSAPATAGGGAGGYCEKLITAPAASYTYTVGAGGGGGAGGASVAGGGAGGTGLIIVDEYYN